MARYETKYRYLCPKCNKTMKKIKSDKIEGYFRYITLVCKCGGNLSVMEDVT